MVSLGSLPPASGHSNQPVVENGCVDVLGWVGGGLLLPLIFMTVSSTPGGYPKEACRRRKNCVLVVQTQLKDSPPLPSHNNVWGVAGPQSLLSRGGSPTRTAYSGLLLKSLLSRVKSSPLYSCPSKSEDFKGDKGNLRDKQVDTNARRRKQK